MPVIYAIGFAVCYFVFDLSWWMSLLIALAAPAALGIVMLVIGMPVGGVMLGIEALINKIKERRRRTRWPDE